MEEITQFDLFFEPTDRRKAIKALSSNHHRINYASPNIMELRAMANFLQPNNNINNTNDIQEIVNLSKIVLKFIDVLLITRGSAGVVTIKEFKEISSSTSSSTKFEVRHYTPEVLKIIENVSGAGDCFSSGFINGLLLQLKECESISAGFRAARAALLSEKTVPSTFNMFHCDEVVKCNIMYF